MLQRFTNPKFNPMSEDALKATVPSIFSSDKSEKTSERYTQISTWQVLQAMLREGYQPVKAMQCNSRNKDNKPYAKHMIRLRHADAVADQGGLFPELVLVNSHDGLSSYRLMAGLYRLVCSNGMIAGKTYNDVRVKHTGDIVGQIIEGTYSVIDTANNMLEVAHEMESIKLSQDEKLLLAQGVHSIRFPTEGHIDKEGAIIQSGITPAQLLRAKRSADSADNLWATFNVLQENALKGGIQGRIIDANRRVRYARSREVKSIDKNTSLNQALWTLAEEMKKLKSA